MLASYYGNGPDDGAVVIFAVLVVVFAVEWLRHAKRPHTYRTFTPDEYEGLQGREHVHESVRPVRRVYDWETAGD